MKKAGLSDTLKGTVRYADQILNIMNRGVVMVERRNISRVEYSAKSVIVVCDTGEKYMVETKNVSPLGMGVIMPGDSPDIVGKDIIIVASTLIMYADVNRQEKNEDGTFTVGISAKEFTPEVLQYLFNHIGNE